MKHLIATFLAAVSLLGGALHAQEEFIPDAASPTAAKDSSGPQNEGVKYTLLKPNDKTSEVVREMDRNPFGRSDAELQAQTQKGSNEENQIRDLLAKLRVVGVSPGANGLRVMLGDMVLEAGQLVPQVLAEQTISLRVASITSEAINLVWVEAKPSGLPPRALTIPVDLRPYVRVQLKGQPNVKNKWEKQTENAGSIPVARQFPATAQSAAFNADYMARNGNPPKALPVGDEEEIHPATVPAAVSPAEEKSSKEWDQAMKLLQKLVPAPAQKP
ncbi:MAG TPA: hypothetical protein VLE43_06955 [Candidatus Saccharimonadia bacterium]|nr:hypothetical protein [Candidatus Saccharimonadia bacterium]